MDWVRTSKCKTNNTHHYVYKMGLPSIQHNKYDSCAYKISFEIYFITTPHGPYLCINVYYVFNNRMGNEIYYACKNNNYWVIML